jgi:hypothetical protein
VKALASTLALALIIGCATSAQAKDPPKSNGNSAQILKNGLDAIIAEASQTRPPAKTVDKDQGDDHASDRAKDVVCNKDTPAARRSAICPVPVSP